MASKPEQNFYAAMRKNAPPEVNLERIENLASRGWADILMEDTICGGSIWLETKVVHRPDRPTSVFLRKTDISAEQINWHKRRRQFAQASVIVWRDQDRNLYILKGKNAAYLTLAEVTALKCRVEDWPDFFSKLRAIIGVAAMFSARKHTQRIINPRMQEPDE